MKHTHTIHADTKLVTIIYKPKSINIKKFPKKMRQKRYKIALGSFCFRHILLSVVPPLKCSLHLVRLLWRKLIFPLQAVVNYSFLVRDRRLCPVCTLGIGTLCGLIISGPVHAATESVTSYVCSFCCV